MKNKKIGREIVKFAIDIPAAYGTGYLVGTGVRMLTAGAHPVVKVCALIGGCVIAEVIVSEEMKWVSRFIDECCAPIDVARELREPEEILAKEETE